MNTQYITEKSVLEKKIDDAGKKILILAGLLKSRPDYDGKVSDIETKYFTTSDYNKFINEILNKNRKKRN